MKGKYSLCSQVLVCSRGALPGFDVGHSSVRAEYRWTEYRWTGRRHGGVPGMVTHHGLWAMVIVVMCRKRDARWSKGERFGVLERERQDGGWMDMRVEESIRMGGLEGHCR